MTEATPGTPAGHDVFIFQRCTVLRAGVHHDGVVRVSLREINGSFQIDAEPLPGVRREVLDMALTAISTETTVDVALANPKDPSGFTVINAFYRAAPDVV